jgi:acetolactate synthase I/II/III large subunit
MNGAEAILQSLIGGGIEVCFANPGTSEMHFVSALDRIESIRCVLGLAETVVTGAADAYARISGKPAVTLLHLGPGLANALSNLHNARRGPVPMVNIVGDHATYHAKLDAPLASDIMSLAKSMSHWVRRMEVLSEAGADTAAAIAASHEGAGRIATLILPADIAWSDGPVAERAFTPQSNARSADPPRMNAAIEALNSGLPTLILLGGNLSRARLQKAAAIAAKHGARLARELFPTLLAHGEGVPTIEHMPYPPELMHTFFAGVRHVVLIGASTPTTFFAYPGVNSSPVPEDCQLHVLAEHDESIDPALDELLEKTSAAGTPFERNPRTAAGEYAARPLDAATIATILASEIPANSIVIDESVSSAPPLMPALRGAAEHEWIFATGGSIGWGIPASVGAAIAAPGRKVVCLEGDGSSMYSFQGLWTLAREKLDVVVVIYANRDYSILKTEFDRVGAQAMGKRAHAMMNIANPTIDFVGLARSLGVPAARADSTDAFATLLQRAFATKGPSLIEAVIAGATGTGVAPQ